MTLVGKIVQFMFGSTSPCTDQKLSIFMFEFREGVLKY
jgi:hypothetical protein